MSGGKYVPSFMKDNQQSSVESSGRSIESTGGRWTTVQSENKRPDRGFKPDNGIKYNRGFQSKQENRSDRYDRERPSETQRYIKPNIIEAPPKNEIPLSGLLPLDKKELDEEFPSLSSLKTTAKPPSSLSLPPNPTSSLSLPPKSTSSLSPTSSNEITPKSENNAWSAIAANMPNLTIQKNNRTAEPNINYYDNNNRGKKSLYSYPNDYRDDYGDGDNELNTQPSSTDHQYDDNYDSPSDDKYGDYYGNFYSRPDDINNKSPFDDESD